MDIILLYNFNLSLDNMEKQLYTVEMTTINRKYINLLHAIYELL